MASHAMEVVDLSSEALTSYKSLKEEESNVI